jgi:hypothetical protein
MAYTTLQNCQRAIVLLWFATIAVVIVLLTVRLIKKKIDLRARPAQDEPASESAADKYKESELTQHQFEQNAVRSTILTDNDTCTERLMKKVCEYNVTFNPLLLAVPLNLVLGRSMGFSVAMFVIAAVWCYLFNVFKVHRAWIEMKAGRLFLETLWITLGGLVLVNIWTTQSSSMLYRLTAG